jgi:ATP-dependent RNA helicase DDX49/DBP8
MELFSAGKASKKQRVEGLGALPKTTGTPKDTTPIDPASGKLTAPTNHTFADLGLCDWIVQSTGAMGFRWPTEIQRVCIPAILGSRDVMGCAETGAGKTAAFALPILHHLSEDPYGIFAVVLTPTRELAIQIAEQFSALGAPMSVRTCLVIGGISMTEQSLQLAKRPHVVIATPGRLRHHLEEGGGDPPNLSRSAYLVLDEADRLLSTGFSSELKVILSHMSSKKRRTLLFSATLTSSLSELETLAMKDTLRFDLTSEQRIPAQLVQQYVFIPAQVKLSFLAAVLQKILKKNLKKKGDNEDEGGEGGEESWTMMKKSTNKNKRKKNNHEPAEDDAAAAKNSSSSIIIFVGSCRRCQEVAEILNELGIDCVALHSMMTQLRRMAALGKFKSQVSRILIATDVASRGLDIPAVDVVINLDLPKVAIDYVHRIGRTARAGRVGRALSMVTQYDTQLVLSIEAFTGVKLELSDDVTETDAVPLLNVVAKAQRVSQMRLQQIGFDEKVEKREKLKSLSQKKRENSRSKETKVEEH